MRLPILQSLALACALTLTACATAVPEHVALAPAARASIESTEVVAPVPQNEIYIYMPPSRGGASGGAAFGMLGAIVGATVDAAIDASNLKNATTDVKPLRDALVDYNFDDRLKGDLKSNLTTVDWLKVNDVRILKDTTPISVNKSISDSKNSAVLMVVSDYQLNADASALTITLNANLFANSAALKKQMPSTAKADMVAYIGNALYRTKLVETVSVPGTKGDRKANMVAWSADNGKVVRVALDEASAKLSKQLAEDIQKAPEPAPSGKKSRK